VQTYRNYELQKTILPVSSPFRVWKYEIRNTVTDRKFVYEVRIEDCLKYNSMPLEDLEETVERRIKWALNEEIEKNRILKFVRDETCK